MKTKANNEYKDCIITFEAINEIADKITTEIKNIDSNKQNPTIDDLKNYIQSVQQIKKDGVQELNKTYKPSLLSFSKNPLYDAYNKAITDIDKVVNDKIKSINEILKKKQAEIKINQKKDGEKLFNGGKQTRRHKISQNHKRTVRKNK